MSHRSWLSVILALFLASLAATPAAAGGWAVVTLDELPTDVVAGLPVEIGFMVLQHGRTPTEGLSPVIIARHLDTSEAVRVEAVSSGDPGHYAATLTLPTPGEWSWKIDAFSTVSMPSLQVTGSDQPAGVSSSSLLSVWVSVLMIAMATLVLVISIMRRVRWGYGLAVAIALMGVVAFLFASVPFKQGNQPAQAAAPSSGQVEVGQALFIAKGCTTCHLNGNVDPRYVDFSTELGPNLTQFEAAPEYLRLWLKDPQAIKPNTEMPNLDLDEAEIEALIAFLNQTSGQ